MGQADNQAVRGSQPAAAHGSDHATARFVALPKQYRFLLSNADEVLYSGAYGAGKTLALAFKLLSRACIKGAREGLFRRDLQDLYNTTLQTLLVGDGIMPPVLAPGYYEWNRSRRTIDISGGGTIVYGGLDSLDKLGSLNLTGAAVDECHEIEKKIWIGLGGRIRVEVPGLRLQLYGACNPGPPTHHLAQRFGIRRATHVPDLAFKGEKDKPIRCEAIMTKSADNPHLPTAYMARLASFTGVMAARYVRGEWVGSEGLIYDVFSRDQHVIDRMAA